MSLLIDTDVADECVICYDTTKTRSPCKCACYLCLKCFSKLLENYDYKACTICKEKYIKEEEEENGDHSLSSSDTDTPPSSPASPPSSPSPPPPPLPPIPVTPPPPSRMAIDRDFPPPVRYAPPMYYAPPFFPPPAEEIRMRGPGVRQAHQFRPEPPPHLDSESDSDLDERNVGEWINVFQSTDADAQEQRHRRRRARRG